MQPSFAGIVPQGKLRLWPHYKKGGTAQIMTESGNLPANIDNKISQVEALVGDWELFKG